MGEVVPIRTPTRIKAGLPPAGSPRVWNTATGKPGVLIAVPSLTGNIRWSIAHQFAKLGQLSNHPGHPFEYSTLFKICVNPIQYARNQIVDAFMDNPAFEWLLMIDDDQEVPDNFWTLLMVEAADIVLGMTFCWVGTDYVQGRLRVNQYTLNDKQQCVSIKPRHQSIPYEIDIGGTGCMAIRRRVIEKIGRNPFQFTHEDNGKVKASEDVGFCIKAKAAGFRIAVHPQVVFGHIKPLDLLQVSQWAESRFAMMSNKEPEDPARLVSISQ